MEWNNLCSLQPKECSRSRAIGRGTCWTLLCHRELKNVCKGTVDIQAYYNTFRRHKLLWIYFSCFGANESENRCRDNNETVTNHCCVFIAPYCSICAITRRLVVSPSTISRRVLSRYQDTWQECRKSLTLQQVQCLRWNSLWTCFWTPRGWGWHEGPTSFSKTCTLALMHTSTAFYCDNHKISL